jgi:P4 family phage/plasmid primase-like protien
MTTTTPILTFMNANNLSYRCIWYFIRPDELNKPAKHPVLEKNNISLAEVKATRWQKKDKPELDEIRTFTKNPIVKSITDEEYKNLHPTFSIYLKHTEKFHVIDVDVWGINSMDDFVEQTGITMFKNTAWTVGNTKGIHILIYVNNMIEYSQQQKVFKGFDGDFLRKNNLWEKRDRVVNNSTIETFEWKDIEPLCLVDRMIGDDKTTKKSEKKPKKPVVVSDGETDVESVSTESTTTSTIINVEEVCNNIREFVKAILDEDIVYFDNYPEWIQLGFIIFNETNGSEMGADLFVELTGLFNTTDPSRAQRTKSAIYAQYHATQPNRKTTGKKGGKLMIGSLYSWLESVNPTHPLIKKSQNNTGNSEFDNMIDTAADYDYAVYFNKKWGHNFKCISQTKSRYFYEFNKDHLWVQNPNGSSIRNIISNEMCDDLKKYIECLEEDLKSFKPDDDRREYIKKKIGVVHNILISFKKTTQKDHIVREVCDIIEDNKFEDNINKQEYILPLKNKRVINMKTLEIRERTINDKFTYECGADYIDLTEEQEQQAKDYFMSLFCNNEDTMKCVLNIIKSCFTGIPLRYLFVATGSGRNGKSLLFKLLKIMFKGGMDVISKDVILEKKSNSNLNTEMEKLDKCRIGYVSELKETDKMNETNIKEITGGDPINLRTLQKTDSTLIATCCLWILTNQLPSFNVEPAIMDRLIVVPLNNKFPVDPTYEKKMIDMIDVLFTYILKHGVIQYEFDLTEEMKQSKSDYEEDNKKDYLGDFIDDYIVESTKAMKRDQFRELYNEFCKKKGYKIDKSTDASFVRKIQKDYKIEYDKNNKRFLNIKFDYNKNGDDDDEIEKSD